VCLCNRRCRVAGVLADTIIRVGCRPNTAEVLDDLCGIHSVTAAGGWAEVDTWPLISGGCYHVTEAGEPYGL